MKIYTDNRLLSAGWVGGTVSRHSGNMCDPQAQAPVYRQLGIPAEKILHFHQTHSVRILPVLSEPEAVSIRRAPLQDADAWVFSTCGWGAAILTADCVPLFLWDENGRYAALAHCGWRGVVQHLAYKTACALTDAGARNIRGWLGPHIQSCCFEVQQEVAGQFSPQSVLCKNGKIFINLNTEILHQLQQAGVAPAAVKTPYYCTCGDGQNFFSWRRDHIRQNMLSFIYKP